MFDNEVFVDKQDKELMLKNITEINQILEKYPYFKEGTHYNAVTAISRVKNFAKDTERWIKLLDTKVEYEKNYSEEWLDGGNK